MKKTVLFLCSIGLAGGLSLVAQDEQQKQVVAVIEQLTPEAWDQKSFASLESQYKKVVIGLLQETQKSFQNTYDSVDKGVDAFMKSYGHILQFYGQVATTLTPRADVYGAMLPVIKALEILPSADDAWAPVTRFLSISEQTTEQDFKRAMNKAFRNKETKVEIKAILKKQCACIDAYVTYLNTKYATEVAELTELEAQVQAQIEELMSKMQDQQG